MGREKNWSALGLVCPCSLGIIVLLGVNNICAFVAQASLHSFNFVQPFHRNDTYLKNSEINKKLLKMNFVGNLTVYPCDFIYKNFLMVLGTFGNNINNKDNWIPKCARKRFEVYKVQWLANVHFK